MLDKNFNPQQTEAVLYSRWEAQGFFEPEDPQTTTKEPFAILMPPPNVTGTLHVGHALDNTLADIQIRRARMQGKNALYLPGTDHASIAVHVVIERQLRAEGTDKFTLGREKFMERAWAWKEFSQQSIYSELRQLGISCAWNYARFTLDEGCSKAVQQVFIGLHQRGLIYRGKRLVNWDPVMQTAVSDLEVKHKEVQGHLWHIRYPLADGSGFVTVATTRPETLLGDTAVAIHPDDPRHQHLLGKEVKLPLTDRLIPVIADDFVEKDFGSGVVKITPAHDFNDFEVGKRHALPMISVFTKTATVADDMPAAYRGLDRFKARQHMVADLEALGFLEKIEPHTSQVGHAERDDTVLEPLLTDQWYVKAGPLAEECLKAAQHGEVTFLNKSDEANYYNWLNNIQDWCISRQLWWGHRIPAWHNDRGDIVVAEAPPHDGQHWTQDPDILDTWFSSALWPFSTLGWPEQTAKLAHFYPQAVIMPGRDILFFWIIRMMMMSKAFMGQAPFKQIYCHAMVLDEKGQKMSKSKGNVISPLDMIAQFGTDALRFSLSQQAALGQDIRMSESSVAQGRNFGTKLWNAAKYIDMQQGSAPARLSLDAVTHPVNRWIVSELRGVIAQVDAALEGFRFNEYSHTLYQFVWNTFCDWYLELSKPLMQSTDTALVTETRVVLSQVFEAIVRLLHPVMPFITEEIWQHHTQGQQGATVSQSAWPLVTDYPQFPEAQNELNWLMMAITALRTARAENRVPPAHKIMAELRGDADRFHRYTPFFALMARVEGFTDVTREPTQTDAVVVIGGVQILLPLAGIVDFEAEKARLQKELERLTADFARVQAQLNNEGFVARAPADVVAEKRVLAQSLSQNMAELQAAISML